MDSTDLQIAISIFDREQVVCLSRDNLDAFLALTVDTGVSASERLRQLAIKLEYRSSGIQYGWEALRSIYELAAKLAPGDFRIYHSWGITATAWSRHWYTADLSERSAIALEAERAFYKALDRSPNDSRIAHSLALLYYDHPQREGPGNTYKAQAIFWFNQAVEWDPGMVIAQLYLAHCFHDEKDWSRAISAYEKVDQVRLAREWPGWRAVKCREQLAHCYAMSGQAEQAKSLFSRFLDEIEQMNECTAKETVVNVCELVDALLHKLDEPELLRRTREQVMRLGLQNWHKDLFV
jgi:tetratricopeptide (TPR) repeat protein